MNRYAASLWKAPMESTVTVPCSGLSASTPEWVLHRYGQRQRELLREDLLIIQQCNGGDRPCRHVQSLWHEQRRFRRCSAAITRCVVAAVENTTPPRGALSTGGSSATGQQYGRQWPRSLVPRPGQKPSRWGSPMHTSNRSDFRR